MGQKIVLSSILAILVIFGIFIGSLIFLQQKQLSALAVLETQQEQAQGESEKAAKVSPLQIKNPAVCSGTQCNPKNSQQICINGQWASCPSDQVCNLGNCVTPKTIFLAAGSGGGGGGGGSSSSSPASPETPETTTSLGEITGGMPEEISLGEKALFTINSTEHSVKLQQLTETTTIVQVKNGDSFTISLGEEKLMDDDNNGQNDFSIQLRSINIILNKAKFIITQL
ncbi:hypothetical protein HYV50_03625 [Candidatus Pacearchaeota archaeon]|nr:hypothetical protein [Candidatus Pacearchaeota archaeon]